MPLNLINNIIIKQFNVDLVFIKKLHKFKKLKANIINFRY